MKTVVNPVQIISDFLKSEYGVTMQQTLEATSRTILLDVVNGNSFTLGKDGFRVCKEECEEAAIAYDIYDIFVAKSSAETTGGEGDEATSFACFIHQCLEKQMQ